MSPRYTRINIHVETMMNIPPSKWNITHHKTRREIANYLARFKYVLLYLDTLPDSVKSMKSGPGLLATNVYVMERLEVERVINDLTTKHQALEDKFINTSRGVKPKYRQEQYDLYIKAKEHIEDCFGRTFTDAEICRCIATGDPLVAEFKLGRSQRAKIAFLRNYTKELKRRFSKNNYLIDFNKNSTG